MAIGTIDTLHARKHVRSSAMLATRAALCVFQSRMMANNEKFYFIRTARTVPHPTHIDARGLEGGGGRRAEGAGSDVDLDV